MDTRTEGYKLFLEANHPGELLERDRRNREAEAQAKELAKIVGRVQDLIEHMPTLFEINDDKSYELARAKWRMLMNALPQQDDSGGWEGDAPSPGLLWLIRQLGESLAAYSAAHSSLGADIETETSNDPTAQARRTFRVLMDQNELSQSDFPEIGSQGRVSEILNGTRNLTLAHMKKLSERFRVPMRFFVGE